MLTGEERDRTGAHPSGRGRRPRERSARAYLRGGRRWRPLAWCAGLALTVVTVPLALRAADLDGPTPVPQLLAFLPWFLVPGWLALLCAVLTRRVLLALWALVVLAGTGWFLLPYGPDAPPGMQERPSAARFRVLTVNLHLGNATNTLVRTVQRERPQLVAVQECDRHCAAQLRSGPLRDAYPYRLISGADSDHTSRGSALLSVYPLRDSHAVRGRMAMPGATADVQGHPLRVQLAHPSPPKPESVGAWQAELNRLRQYAGSRGSTPTVLAGDFNASQDHAAFRRILRTGMRDASRLTGQSRTPTWPAVTSPPLGAQIDHVLLSHHLAAVNTRFPDFADTDHRAVLTDIRMF